MNRWIYNGTLAAGTLLAGLGAGLVAGPGWACVVVGSLMVAATLAGAWIATQGAR